MKKWQMPSGVFMHTVYTVLLLMLYIIDNYWYSGLLYTYGVRLLRCSFNYGGQCESLDVWGV